MLNTSIVPHKSKVRQPSLFDEMLPLNARVRLYALRQIEEDFLALLDEEIGGSAKGLRQAMCNFDRDFTRVVGMGFKPSDIIGSVIKSLHEKRAFASAYYPTSDGGKSKSKKKSKKGGK